MIRHVVLCVLLFVGSHVAAFAQPVAPVPTWEEKIFPQVFLGTPGLPNDWQAYLSVTAGPHPTTITVYIRTEDEPPIGPGVIDRGWYPYAVDVPANQRVSLHLNHIFWFRFGRQVQAGGTVKANCSYECTMAIGQHRSSAFWSSAFVLQGERK